MRTDTKLLGRTEDMDNDFGDDDIREVPRCPYYLDEKRCMRRVHEGDHEVAQGDSVFLWPSEGDLDEDPTLLEAVRKTRERLGGPPEKVVTISVPEIGFKGPLDTDAGAYLQVAQNLDGNYPAGGSNVRRAVSRLLRNVATQLTDDPRPTSVLRRAGK